MDLCCNQIISLTPDIKCFEFSVQDQPLPPFAAGQHLRLQVIIDGQNHWRPYSISSRPGQPLAITVKALQQGKVSRWLHDHGQLGMKLQAELPSGQFQLQDKHPSLFIAAGSGISPIISMLRHLDHQQDLNDSVLVYGARHRHDLAYLDELQQLAKRGLTLVLVLSQAPSDWQGPKGHIDMELLQQVPELQSHQVYCCAPIGLMQGLAQALFAHGLPKSAFHQETFVPTTDQTVSPVSASRQDFQLEFQGEFLTVNGEQSLLEQIEDAGFYLASSCRGGSCGSCKCRLVAGQIRSLQPFYALSEQEEQQGYVLACSCTPDSDLCIETD